MGDEPVVLFNCTGRDIHVDVDGERVPLPALPRPQILDRHGPASTLTVRVGDRQVTLDLEEGGVEGTLFLPEPVDGFRYLVPADLLVRLPHRGDLLTPALYGGHQRDNAQDDDPDHDWLSRLCLTAVTARLDPAGPDPPNIRIDDLESSDE